MTSEEFMQYMTEHLTGSRRAANRSTVLYFMFPYFREGSNLYSPHDNVLANVSILVFDNGRIMDCSPIPNFPDVSDEDYNRAMIAIAAMERLHHE